MKKWTAKWIGLPEKYMINYSRPSFPVPEFRREFIPGQRIEHPVVFISGLGYFEWTINGKVVTPDHLVPTPTQYDKRWLYKRYELDFPMEGGEKYLFSIKLGNGLYNCDTPESTWHFDRATWRDYPKMIFQLEDEGKVVLVSDSQWVMTYTPTVYDSFRGGECYDARLELPDGLGAPAAEMMPHYETGGRWDPHPENGTWLRAWVVAPPGGIGLEQAFPGCRIMETNEMRQIAPNLWTAEHQVSGVPELRVRGKAGAQVKMICGERISEDGTKADNSHVNCFVKEHFQEDTYILKGSGEEVWHPQFTFHGFLCVETEITGEAEVLGLRQIGMFTGMERIGRIETSNASLRRIDECAVRATTCNFCGFPTDCPTREKNGWTSEAALVMEPLFYSFDCAAPFAAYVDAIIDTQRPSGQIAGIAPTAGFGYNWGSGGHWDLALYDIALETYLRTGDDSCLRRAYPAMKLNLEFQAVVSDDGISSALCDWLPPEPENAPVVGACATGAHIQMLRKMLVAARALGDTAFIPELEGQLAYYKKKYNEHYYLGNGIYRGDRTTYIAMAINWEIVPNADRKLAIQHLHEMLVNLDYKVDYGTIGSRQVPMALLENGLADDAFKLMTQPEYPGYQYMFAKCNNFAETWATSSDSWNHGAFSYVEACLYKYIAGFRHSEERPGKNYLVIAPLIPQDLGDFAAEYLGYRSAWCREGGKIRFSIQVPQGKNALLQLPGGETHELSAGIFDFVR